MGGDAAAEEEAQQQQQQNRRGACLQDLGSDALARVLARLESLAPAAASCRALAAAASAPGFEAGWTLARAAAAAPDRQWQYAIIAAWPAARLRGGGGGSGSDGHLTVADGLARLARFLREALRRRHEAGQLDPSGPGATPAAAEAAAVRVKQLLDEHDAWRRARLSGGGGDGASTSAGTASNDGGSSGATAAARALLLLCPHSEHLLVPYLAQGGHAAAMAAVLPLFETTMVEVLPWLNQDAGARGAAAPPPKHDVLHTAFLAAVHANRPAAARAALDALSEPPPPAAAPAVAAPASASAAGAPKPKSQQQTAAVPAAIAVGALETAVEYGTPELIEGCPRLLAELDDLLQVWVPLLSLAGAAAARKDAGAAPMLRWLLARGAPAGGGGEGGGEGEGVLSADEEALERVIYCISSATPEMAELALDMAARFAGGRAALLEHALGAPALARAVLPRLYAEEQRLRRQRQQAGGGGGGGEKGLFSPPSELAAHITHVLAESADSAGALEVADLLWDLTGGDPAAREGLRDALCARAPAGLLAWYWLHRKLGPRARPLAVDGAYWGVLQAALELSYSRAAADAAAAALEAGMVAPDAAGAGRGELAAARLQAKALAAVAAGDLAALKELEKGRRAAAERHDKKRAARRQKRLEEAAAAGGGEGGAAHDHNGAGAADDGALQALPFGACGQLLMAAETGRLEVLEYLLDRLHSARQLHPHDPLHVDILNRALAHGHLPIVSLLMGPQYGVRTAAVSREPLLPTPLMRGPARRALTPAEAAAAAAVLLEHSRDDPLLLSRWVSSVNAQQPECAPQVTRIVRAALARADADGMPSLPPGARAAAYHAVAEAAVAHGVHSCDRLAAVLDWLGRAQRLARARRGGGGGGAAAAAAAGEGGGEDEDEDDDDSSGLGFDSGNEWLDDEEEWSGDELEREEDHLVSSSTDEDDFDDDDEEDDDKEGGGAGA